MLKKIFKLAGILVVLALLAGTAVVLTLKHMYPPEKIKSMLTAYTQEKFQREISFERLSFNWVGITLTDFAMSESSTFEQGTFVKADRLVAKVALKPLFRKRIEIETISLTGLDVQIVKNQDGSFNFDTLLSNNPQEEQPQASSSTSDNSFVLLAENITAHNCSLSYRDLQSDFSATVKKLNIVLKNFDLANPFKIIISFTSDINLGAGYPQATIPVELDLTAFLANLDMAQAYVTLDNAVAAYQTAKLNLKGDIKNFTKPDVHISGTLTGIDNTLLQPFAPDLPAFSLPDIKLLFQMVANLEAQSLSLNQATISVEDSSFSIGGFLSWKEPAVTYNMKGTLGLDLAQAVKMTDTMDDFRPTGIISGNFSATDKKNFQDVSGVLTLQNVSVMYDNIILSALNGTITAKSPDDISATDLAGLLNGEKITASFSYQNIKDVMNIIFKLNLDKLKLDSFPNSDSTEETPEQTPQTQSENNPQAQPSDWRMNIKTDVTIGEIQVPYFKTGGLVLHVDLTDVTANFDQANGQVTFELQPGAITNLDSVLFQNKIVKILLLPLSLVKKVTGLLKIDLFPTDKTSDDKGSLAFSEGGGDYTFTDGLMTLNKTTFKSKLTDISGSGTINFKTEELDMKVKASVTTITQGTPMVIKITGTMSDPKGKLDVLNTMGSVVGGILSGKMALSTAKAGSDMATGAVTGTAKTAADAVTGTAKTAVGAVKALGGLFKKSSKDKEDAPIEDKQTASDETK